MSDAERATHLQALLHRRIPERGHHVIQHDRHLDEGVLPRCALMHAAMRSAPWQVAATFLCVASLAASTVPVTRHLRGDGARSSDAERSAAPAVPAIVSSPPGLVSVAPLDGRLVIVFPRPSARSSIRLERHGEPFALFGAPHIERTPLVVLPGELRVQELPSTGTDFELRIPAGVTRVDVRIGAETMARWTGAPMSWDYGHRRPLQLPAPG